MARILLIEPQKASQEAIKEMLYAHKVDVKLDANEAMEFAADNRPDLVLLELSLAGHSGMEFLYEFRTYSDWINVPVIIYSSLKLNEEVLESKSWEQLNVSEYLYKPESSLKTLKGAVERTLV